MSKMTHLPVTYEDWCGAPHLFHDHQRVGGVESYNLMYCDGTGTVTEILSGLPDTIKTDYLEVEIP